MKKILLRGMLLALLLCLAGLPALANSWGLTGDLLEVVMADDRWNDYSTITKQQGDFAVLGGRYHNVLMQCKDGDLLTYPLAVYQPEDEAAKPVLKLDGQLLTLSYGEKETYVFRLDYQFDTYFVSDALAYAEVNGLTFNRDGYGFTVSDGESIAFWQRNVLLEDFNILRLPHTMEEVLLLNRMYAVLDSGRNEMDLGASSVNIGKGTAPVYSAPFGESAWRAANGKAAVGLSGQHWRMGDYINADGEAYTRIRYEVSERTQRIGFVRTEDLNTAPNKDNLIDLIHVPVETWTGTWLTDDPLVSQFQQFYVPPGTQFTCMGTYGDDYAWVSAEVKNGKFADGGQIVWGYVPLKPLKLSSADEYRNTIEWDVMAEFAGEWYFAAGGNQAEDILILNADGTYQGYTDSLVNGTWQLTRYNAADNLYWTDVPYEITFFRENGTVSVKGFWPIDGGFSLLNREGSGGYERLEEPFTPPADEDGNG